MKLTPGAVAEAGSTKINKTGSWRNFKPIFISEKCTKCGICSMYCPEFVIKVNKNENCARTDYDYCKGCGICAEECPKGAIKLILEEK
ncbi:MAG: 4Fe-4S binding protein [Methanosarcinales archaeon]